MDKVQLRKGKLIRDDIVLTTRGTLGNVGHYDSFIPYENVRINSGMVIFRCNNVIVNPRYLYWMFRSPFFQNQIERFRSGSAQPQLPIKLINQFSLPFPDISEQKNIAGKFDSWNEVYIALNNHLKNTKILFREYLAFSFRNS